ncbi:MAG TPA: hypothetical protein VG738_12530 [Chitinophagaceae bacterium]|nr:hypothetical protein [Chitinophagaceae bacterium]
MFVFYRIEDFILLEKLQLIKLIVERGFVIQLPQLRLGNFGFNKCRQLETLAEKGMIEIKEERSDVFCFVEKYNVIYRGAGRSLLALLYFCQTEKSIFIVDENETMIRGLAKEMNIQTCSLIEFYKDTLNDEKYLPFIIEIKKNGMIK